MVKKKHVTAAAGATIILAASGAAADQKTIGGKPDFLYPSWEFTVLNKSQKNTGHPAKSKKFKLGKDYGIDLDTVAGKKGKCGDECVITNLFELKKETKLGFGAGADYWFEVKLNGELIYSTFPEGNKGFLKISHQNYQFTGTGKAGSNLLEVRVRRGKATWQIYFKNEPAEATDPCIPLTLEADSNLILGKIKPMNAVNNGPIKARSVQSRGNFEAYRNLEIPYARNHDAAFCSAYGGEHTVDVHAIFPDFSKDPNDPASYDFAPTDRGKNFHINKFIMMGTKIEKNMENGNRVNTSKFGWFSLPKLMASLIYSIMTLPLKKLYQLFKQFINSNPCRKRIGICIEFQGRNTNQRQMIGLVGICLFKDADAGH